MKLSVLFFLSLFGFLTIGCADGDGAAATVSAAPVNTVCPVMGNKVDGETTVDWNGKTVGFCCPPCIDEWNEMNDEERSAAIAEAGQKKADDHDHGHDEDHHHDTPEEHAADEASGEQPDGEATPAE